jgi:hypothetical protein
MADGIDRTDCPVFELLALAYHESGHAIVDHAVWPPNPVVRVTIIPTAEHAGVVELGERREAWRFEVDDDLAEAFLAEADTIQNLAGHAAVGVFLGMGEQLPLPPVRSPDHDNADFSALCTWDGVDGVRLQPRDYLEGTREVLERPDVQLAVARLAAALLRHKTLSGAQVEAIVRDCGVTCERPELPLGWPDFDEGAEGEAFSWSRW